MFYFPNAGNYGEALPAVEKEILMPRRDSLRLLWVALIPVLVFPLYGQSCNRSCPPSPNPCERSTGRSIETGQCVYSDIDGAACDAGRVTSSPQSAARKMLSFAVPQT